MPRAKLRQNRRRQSVLVAADDERGDEGVEGVVDGRDPIAMIVAHRQATTQALKNRRQQAVAYVAVVLAFVASALQPPRLERRGRVDLDDAGGAVARHGFEAGRAEEMGRPHGRHGDEIGGDAERHDPAKTAAG